ncbi:MAG TPA: cupin domain-containing protein [Candidatus Dormibacteraeota bacterium]|nr:cupin domain-containing protein [Candidatus Dormibacteraeota bacterium]
MIVKKLELQDFPSKDGFEGESSGTSVSVILVDMSPGEGVPLHKHPYAEIFIVQEGHASFTVGSSTIDVVAPRTLIGPANVPHGFVNVGDVRLKQVDIHLSPRFVTEWL